MPYGLGIDLGSGSTVAAISRARAEDPRPEVGPVVDLEVAALGARSPGFPTVLHLADDETMIVGTAAERLVLSDPDRVFRGFLHRVGEPSGSVPWRRPAALTARLVRWVAETVTMQEGSLADQITLAHPTGWGPAQRHAVEQALAAFGLPDVVLLPTAVTAATSYAAQCGSFTADAAPQEVSAGQLIAIYDLGVTFSASVAYQDGASVILLGAPQVLLDGGGGRFDELVLGRVLDELGNHAATLELDDPAVLAAMAQLLADCVAAREALDHRPEVNIPVSLTGLQTEIRFTRDEFDLLIAPTLGATVTTLHTAIAAAGVTPADIGAVVVTGGCASMPQLTPLLITELGRPLAALADPGLAAARGAAYLAGYHKDTANDVLWGATPRTGTEAADQCSDPA